MRKSIILVFMIPVIATLVCAVAYGSYVITKPGSYIRAEIVENTAGVMDIQPDEYMLRAIQNPGVPVSIKSDETNLSQKEPRNYTFVIGRLSFKDNGWLIKYNETYYFFSGRRVDILHISEGKTLMISGVLSLIAWPAAIVYTIKREGRSKKS